MNTMDNKIINLDVISAMFNMCTKEINKIISFYINSFIKKQTYKLKTNIISTF